MIHLGDITKIHGYDIPAVDCITGGMPDKWEDLVKQEAQD